VVDERMVFSRGAKLDVITRDTWGRCEKITRIVNVYDRKDGRSAERERPARKLNWKRVILQYSSVLAGDFNAHSHCWDPRCQVQRDAA